MCTPHPRPPQPSIRIDAEIVSFFFFFFSFQDRKKGYIDSKMVESDIDIGGAKTVGWRLMAWLVFDRGVERMCHWGRDDG